MQTPEQTIEFIREWLAKPSSKTKRDKEIFLINLTNMENLDGYAFLAGVAAYHDNKCDVIKWLNRFYCEKLAHKEG